MVVKYCIEQTNWYHPNSVSLLVCIIGVCLSFFSIQGDRSFTHNGDRSKEAIIEFARRAKG